MTLNDKHLSIPYHRANPAQDLPGTWNVVAQLLASTTENPNDPYAPRPGTIKPDTWRIYNGEGGPVLTGSSGSIAGQYTKSGALRTD